MPNPDAGAVYRDGEGQVTRLVYVDDVLKMERYQQEALKTDSRSSDEQIGALKDRYGGFVTADEMVVMIDHLVFSESFKLIADKRNFLGGASTVYRMYRRALKRIEKAYRKGLIQ